VDSLTDVAVFVQVVSDGSFTKAAARLRLSRSVVSKYLARLEGRLGARLLNRTTRRLSLTEAGRIFYERSRRGLQDIDDAAAEVSRLRETPSGVLRINAPMSFGILHIAPALPEFLARHPGVTVEMNLDDRKIDVIEEGFDVSVRITEMPDSSLISRRLAPCRHVIVASPAYLARRGTPRTPEDLRTHNIVSFSYQTSADEWHFRAPDGQSVSVPVSGSIRMNNSLALREAVLCGVGIARMPTFVAHEDLRKKRLVRLLPGHQTFEVSIYVVYSDRRHLLPKVRAFIDFMAARIETLPYWDRAHALPAGA